MFPFLPRRRPKGGKRKGFRGEKGRGAHLDRYGFFPSSIAGRKKRKVRKGKGRGKGHEPLPCPSTFLTNRGQKGEEKEKLTVSLAGHEGGGGKEKKGGGGSMEKGGGGRVVDDNPD